MKRNILLIGLLLPLCVLSQVIRVSKVGERQAGNNLEDIYLVKILNTSMTPICIPISSYFTPGFTENDTLQLPLMPYEGFSGRLYYSFKYAKQDVSRDAERTPVFPFIINPQSYLSTYIQVKRKDKGIYFTLSYSDNNGIDYFKILTRYAKDPNYLWEKGMTFSENSVLLQ